MNNIFETVEPCTFHENAHSHTIHVHEVEAKDYCDTVTPLVYHTPAFSKKQVEVVIRVRKAEKLQINIRPCEILQPK